MMQIRNEGTLLTSLCSCAAAFSALPEDSNTSQDSHHTEGGAKPGNLVLYNSLSRKKEVFKPRATDGTVSMYVVSSDGASRHALIRPYR